MGYSLTLNKYNLLDRQHNRGLFLLHPKILYKYNQPYAGRVRASFVMPWGWLFAFVRKGGVGTI